MYSNYYTGSPSPEEEDPKKEQKEAPVMLLTNYIKRKPGDKDASRLPDMVACDTKVNPRG